LRQGGNIAGSELNVGLEFADVVPSEQRECESVANEGSEKEKEKGRGESSHGMTFLRVEIDRDQQRTNRFINSPLPQVFRAYIVYIATMSSSVRE
jgi:hypothetical protein